MEKEHRKALREQYQNRKPTMGIVALAHGDELWIATSTDAAADQNSTLFQLRLGSWPNKALQKAFSQDPEGFVWSVLKELQYDQRDDDHRDDLELLYMMCLDEHPNAKQMKAGKR